MNEEKIIDEVGKFYAKVYDDTVDFLELNGDKLAEIPTGDREQKLAFARVIAHFTLCQVAAEFQDNEQWELSPSLRYYLFDDGKEIKNLDDRISPIMGWLSDVVPKQGLLGLYGKKPVPPISVYDLARNDPTQ